MSSSLKKATHGQVGVGKELDGFCLGAAAQQHVDVLLDGALLQQGGKGFGAVADFAYYDSGGVEVVVEGFALS